MSKNRVSKQAAQLLINSLDNKVTEDTQVVLNELTEATKTMLEGNYMEQMEAYIKLNALFEVTVNPKTQENLGGVMGRYGQTHSVVRNEATVIEKYEHELRGARLQAQAGDFRVGTVSKVNAPVEFETITAGIAIDYRDLMDSPIDFLKDYIVELMTSIDNLAVKKVVTDLTENIIEASTNGNVIYYDATNGISQSSLNEAIAQVRRSGNANVFGDYRVITQLEDFVGFHADAYVVLAEERLLEIDNLGYIAKYRSCNVTEIKNALDLYSKDATGEIFANTYKTILPESDLFVMADGKMGPNHIFMRGGLTTQKGSNVPSATEEQRWDMEIGTYFVGERAYMIGLIQDTDLI